MGCIYIALNTVNGKAYIGKTIKSLRVRRAWHRNTASRGEGWCFHNALRKYGFEVFHWSVLHESDDYDDLNAAEKAFIVSRKTQRPNGYNLTIGGDGTSGRDPEITARVAEFHRGRKRSSETKRRISESRKGVQSRLGAVLSNETKRKISASLLGTKHTEEAKAKIAAAFRGRRKSPEQKLKMSEARIRWWDRKRAAENLAEQDSLFAATA